MKHYDEGTVVRILTKNPAIDITYSKDMNVVSVVKNATTIGNGTWGKIDFLIKHCGYTLSFVDANDNRAAKLAEAEARRVAKQAAIAEKRASKVDIIGSVKTNLGKVKFSRK